MATLHRKSTICAAVDLHPPVFFVFFSTAWPLCSNGLVWRLHLMEVICMFHLSTSETRKAFQAAGPDFFYFSHSWERKKRGRSPASEMRSIDLRRRGMNLCSDWMNYWTDIHQSRWTEGPKAARRRSAITAAAYVRLASPPPQIAALSRPARGLLQQIIISFKAYYYFMCSMAGNTTALKFNSFYHVIVFLSHFFFFIAALPGWNCGIQRKTIICLCKG